MADITMIDRHARCEHDEFIRVRGGVVAITRLPCDMTNANCVLKVV